MRDAGIEEGAHFQNDQQTGSADRDREFWKHFAAMGGTDKNRMIQTDSWLLGLGALTLGYVVTQMTSWTARPEHFVSVVIVATLGLVISLVTVYVTLVYAGYANRNWAQADAIARRRGWFDLVPKSAASEKLSDKSVSGRSLLAALSWRLARPCEPEKRLAFVFVVFASLATVSALAHAVFLVWAATASPRGPC